jgi:three-Cys-motif partner protein
VFLDPFGMSVDWTTIEAIARTRSIDLWYLVPTATGIGRTATLDGKMDQSWADRLDRMLGTNAWRTEFYKTEHVPDLLSGTVERSSRVANLDAIEAFVQRRLSSIFEGGVAKHGLRLGPRGKPMYMLTFACANPAPSAYRKALAIANHILKPRA